MSCMAALAGPAALPGPAALAERSGLAATAAAVATRSHLGRQLFAAIGSAPLISRAAVALGGVPASQPISLDIALKPRDPAGLASFVSGVSTPGSPQFRKYLGPGAFGSRFGATTATVTSVVASLKALGLSVGPVSSNHLVIRSPPRSRPPSALSARRWSATGSPPGRSCSPTGRHHASRPLSGAGSKPSQVWMTSPWRTRRASSSPGVVAGPVDPARDGPMSRRSPAVRSRARRRAA